MDDTRLKWTSEHIKLFLESCIEEVAKGGRQGGSLRKQCWVDVGKKMNDTFQLIYSQKQLKNQYDYIRMRYRAWSYLKNRTGNTYNSATNTFNLSNEEWDALNKGHQKLKTLKSSPLLFPELCETLFDKTSATGLRARSVVSSSRVSGSASSNPPFQLQDEEDDNEFIPDVQSIPSFSMPNEEEANETEPIQNPSNIARASEGPADTSKAKKKRKTDDQVDMLLEDVSNALKSIVTTHQQASSMQQASTQEALMRECAVKLNSIGLDELDPLYCAAFEIFGHSEVLRYAWMNLPSNPTLLKRWIGNTATRLGFLKN